MQLQPSDPIRSVTAFDPVTIDPGYTLVRMARVMAASNCGALLVRGHDGAVSIVTERDVVCDLGRSGADIDWAADIMTRDPLTVEADRPIVEVARLMVEAGVRHMIVEDGERLGVVSIRDVVEPLLEAAEVRG